MCTRFRKEEGFSKNKLEFKIGTTYRSKAKGTGTTSNDTVHKITIGYEFNVGRVIHEMGHALGNNLFSTIFNSCKF